MDVDRDTIIAPTQTGGDRAKLRGNRKNDGKKRAKWVDPAERERRRENKLCFRYRSSGHRFRECPYAVAVQTTINVASFLPLLEDDDDDADSAVLPAGKV